MSDRALPKEDSDYSLPGRADESDAAYFVPSDTAKPKSRVLMVSVVVFVLFSAGIFTYYFVNQNQIDSQIVDNMYMKTPEGKMVEKYNVGRFGSDHAHAVIAVYVHGDKINFGLPQFQLQSKYIHFENHNSYQIHKHATSVPLEMLFLSFGFEITENCITLGTDDAISDETFCADPRNSLVFMINGIEVNDILSYEIQHDDRILISFGDDKLHSEQLAYLASLQVHDVPEKKVYNPGDEISV